MITAVMTPVIMLIGKFQVNGFHGLNRSESLTVELSWQMESMHQQVIGQSNQQYFSRPLP